jgi:hypothetical protein
MTDKIQLRTKFWTDLWEDLILNFLKRSYGLTLYSPNILVDDIITEIEENAFKNIDNKKYFYSKLCYYFENDFIIKQQFNSSFKILRTIFNSERNNYILETAKSIKIEFEKGLYFDNCIEYLKQELCKDENISIEFISTITNITQNLIVEFIKKGYVLEDIEKFTHNIFDNYNIKNIDNTDFLTTDYPHPFRYENYEINGEFDRQRFNSDICSLIDNLTLEDRIKSLSSFFYKEKEKVNYIFIVEGLKGSADLKIGDVNFYSLDKKRFIKEIKNIDNEDLQRRIPNDKEKFIQVSVEVDYLLPKSSLSNAITKLENTLDLIISFHNTKTQIEVNTSNYLISKNDRRIYSSLRSNRNDMLVKHSNSLNINEANKSLNSLNNFKFLWKENDSNKKTKSKLTNAIHWYSKAEQSTKQEDKMLNYWIAIENLFNLEYDIKKDVLNCSKKGKIQLIQEVVTSVQIFKYIYEYGWELYWHYNNIVTNRIFVSDKNNFPTELIAKANLNPEDGESIHLQKFIESLDLIRNYETDLFLIQKIDTISQFYNNASSTKKIIEDHIKLIENDILMIYRFRNLIVHNAHFDNALLPYLVWKIRDYSGDLIRKLIFEYNENNVELSNLMINLFLKKEKFINDLEGNKVNLFQKE